MTPSTGLNLVSLLGHGEGQYSFSERGAAGYGAHGDFLAYRDAPADSAEAPSAALSLTTIAYHRPRKAAKESCLSVLTRAIEMPGMSFTSPPRNVAGANPVHPEPPAHCPFSEVRARLDCLRFGWTRR